ncbi:MAG: hypothetical protein ALAOOOJD_04606 [bacterium]|nr:hypothetical protein [bacterium]
MRSGQTHALPQGLRIPRGCILRQNDQMAAAFNEAIQFLAQRRQLGQQAQRPPVNDKDVQRRNSLYEVLVRRHQRKIQMQPAQSFSRRAAFNSGHEADSFGAINFGRKFARGKLRHRHTINRHRNRVGSFRQISGPSEREGIHHGCAFLAQPERMAKRMGQGVGNFHGVRHAIARNIHQPDDEAFVRRHAHDRRHHLSDEPGGEIEIKSAAIHEALRFGLGLMNDEHEHGFGERH